MDVIIFFLFLTQLNSIVSGKFYSKYIQINNVNIFIVLKLYFFNGKNEASSNKNDIEETITVLLPNDHEEKVLACEINIEINDDYYYEVKLYNSTEFFLRTGDIAYIGQKNNSCSFVLYSNHLSDILNRDRAAIMRKKWQIRETFECKLILEFWDRDTWSSCSRKYNVFFNPQSTIEILSMAGSKTKIIRPYNDKSLSIFLTSEQYNISSCTLIFHENDDLSTPISDDMIIYRKDKFNNSIVENEIEYLGDRDNSCSFRVNLDVIQKSNIQDKFFNRTSWVKVVFDDSDSWWTSDVSYYKLSMHPLSWWKQNRFSNVFVTRRLSSFDAQYY